MPDYALHFDSEPFESLDRLALLARQDYNLGGAVDWFGEFRGGLFSFYGRLYGLQRHYSEVHAWLPRVRTPTETEYHVASILFQMDSAFECLTFALNALGWAVVPAGFRDITDYGALRRISPLDILGEPSRTPPLVPEPGYAQLFPTFQAEWQAQQQLIARIRDLHDVSKHRKSVDIGGQRRLDPPAGFFESLGITEEPSTLFHPEAEIVLRTDPKSPSVQRLARPAGQRELLEDLVPPFANFINSSGAAALADAHAKVPLKVSQFPGGASPEVRRMGV